MKRTLVFSLLPLVAAPLAVGLSAAGVAAADAPGACIEPVAERSYTHDQLTYRLAVDLTDCAWWDRKPIQLDAALARISAGGDGADAGSFTWCGVGPVSSDGENGPEEGGSGIEAAAGAGGTAAGTAPDDSDGNWMRPGVCAVEVSLDHPTLDPAHYKGEITFPWQDGRRTVSFNAVCQAATGCVDLPLDPTTALAPASELYDAIAGDSNAG
jgi:hypothetical protein